MKLHTTLVETLIKTYEVNSGWTEEKKLREVLNRLDVTVYRQTDGTEVLVSTQELQEQVRKFEMEQAQRRGE
jgi:polyhydroxyalkanoate synthesis regulator phasin